MTLDDLLKLVEPEMHKEICDEFSRLSGKFQYDADFDRETADSMAIRQIKSDYQIIEQGEMFNGD